ncbi:cation:proton antiporter [Loktanella sp. 3ANDIMAR09]|uniref:cation:proton antiporter domain-containing protein n=1 Tax=Loktanella sp. 3ANDIMAR09 TaxID=1225657 RepID=UPI0009FA34F1|nr:cation:proton antiporter [Loktanella sp. 3ANDIMAR09]
MTDVLMLAFVFLVAGVASVPIATRFGLGSVLGYLIAGVLISPLLGLMAVDVESIQHFAEFGIVMMLFLVGLELDPAKLWDMRARLLGLGGGQVVLTMLAVTGVAMALGQTWQVGLAIGAVLALSSTAIVLQTLNEKGLMRSDGGQSMFSVLLMQDIAVIPMLALLPLLATGIGAEQAADATHDLSLVAGLPGWQTALVNALAVIAVIVVGYTLTGPVFRFIAKADMRELFVAAALMMVVGIALLMTLVGLSPALGTFIAGVVLAGSDWRHELEADIDPFRGLLLGLFFMTVGAGINFALLADQAVVVIALTLGLLLLKGAVLWVLALAFRLERTDRWLFALGLAQAGEFGFVLLSFVTAGRILPQDIADTLLLVVTLSMLLTPALFILYERVILPRADQQLRAADTVDEAPQVIIAGHGRFGGVVKRILEGGGIHPVVIDYSARQLDMLRVFGMRAYFGDASRPEMLEAAGIRDARMLVVAIDDRDSATRIVAHVHENYPHVHIVARARDRHHVYELYAAGCRDIIRETFDSAVRTGRSALVAMGTAPDVADRMTSGYVDDDRALLIAMAPVFQQVAGNPMDPAYVEKARALRALQDQIFAEGGASFGQLKSRMAARGDDVDEIVRTTGMALQPRDE